MEKHEHYIWGTCQESRQRAISLYTIRSIVERYGGTVNYVNMKNHTVDCTVPADREEECAIEVEKAMAEMGSYT